MYDKRLYFIFTLLISFKDDHINWQKFVNEEDERYN
jgi:hypothetical protein